MSLGAEKLLVDANISTSRGPGRNLNSPSAVSRPDGDLAVIVAQIAAARMEIGEQISLQSLNNFLVDTRNVYLVAHIGSQLAGALHAVHYVHPSGHTYVYVDELDTDEAFRRRAWPRA